MIPSNFDQSNHILGPPAGMTEAEVGSLNVFVGDMEGKRVTIARFRPMHAEVVAMAAGASVWMHILGTSFAPVQLLCADPFKPIVSSFVSAQDAMPVDPTDIGQMAQKAAAIDIICDMVLPDNPTATPEEVVHAVSRFITAYKKAAGIS